MTPKDKAKELVDKMWNIDERYGSIGFHEAKQCALVAVDEILNFDLKAKNESQFIIERRIEDYWEEVKQEIEKYEQQ